MHLTPDSDVNPLHAEEFERSAFKEVNETAGELGMEVSTMYRATPVIGEAIIEEANSGSYELLLVGASKGLFSDDELGGVIRPLLDDVKPHLGILLERGFKGTRHIFFPILNELDLELVPLLERLAANGTEKISVLDPSDVWKLNPSDPLAERVHRISAEQLQDSFWEDAELVVASPQRWVALKATQSAWLDLLPPVLIFRPGSLPLSP